MSPELGSVEGSLSPHYTRLVGSRATEKNVPGITKGRDLYCETRGTRGKMASERQLGRPGAGRLPHPRV